MKLVAWISSTLAALDQVVDGARASPPPVQNPVVLVHGIYSTAADFARLARHLREEGHEVLTLDLIPNNGLVGLDELAGQLADFVKARLPEGRFDLVGFSMGGLVSRYYMQRLGGARRVDHFVTLAAPHHGTWMAWANRLPGGHQMRRHSAFIRDLGGDQDCLKNVRFTSFYTPLDLIVVPGASAEMPEARNVCVWALMHPSLILEKRCIRAVAEALKEKVSNIPT